MIERLDIMRNKALAVDIGTSSVRAMVFSNYGEILSRSQTEYRQICSAPGFEEQNPDEILEAAFATIASCLKGFDDKQSIACISFSSQMYGIFAVDYDAHPLCHNILWSDSRSVQEERFIKREWDGSLLYKTTGCPVNSIYCLPKLLWIKNNLPEVFEQAALFVSIKSYVIHALTGLWVEDWSMASATGFFDVTSHQWFEYAIAKLGIEKERLCRLVAPETVLDFKNPRLLNEWGLSESVKVVPASGDGPLANVGSGAWEVGDINVDLGTSGAMRVVLDHSSRESNSGLWCYCLSSDRWAYGGILTNAGNAYKWLAENIGFYVGNQPVDMDKLNELTKKIPLGAEGLLFLPYLRAARSPYWDSSLKGVLYGLAPRHNVGHIAMALFESIAFDLLKILDSMKKQVNIKEFIIFTGGLSKSKLMPQILADVLDCEIRVPNENEGSIKGAAIIGFKAMGVLTQLSFDANHDGYTSYRSISSNSCLYREISRKYFKLVELFKGKSLEELL